MHSDKLERIPYDIEIFILAGGKSSRMGQDKGLMDYHGRPMIEHVLKAVAPLHRECTIVANNPAYEVFGLPVVRDLVQQKGPMGGLWTAIQHAKKNMLLLLACDYPLITTALLRSLMALADGQKIVMPFAHQQLHPLIAVYPVSIRDKVQKILETDQLQMSQLIDTYPYLGVELGPWLVEKPHLLDNLNTPADFQHSSEIWKTNT